MKLGLTSAILAEMAFEDVLGFLAANGIAGIEPMCWPVGSGDRCKFAGVTHIDVAKLNRNAVLDTMQKLKSAGLTITGLGC